MLGNAPGLNYASDYRNVSGVVVPTKRRVFAYDSEKRKIPGAPLVAIDAGRSLRKVFENRKSLNLWGGYIQLRKSLSKSVVFENSISNSAKDSRALR